MSDAPDEQDFARYKKLIPRYYDLLGEAQAASDAVDMFDLHSEDPQSVKAYKELYFESIQHQMHLINFVRDNWAELSFALGLTTGETINRLEQRS